MTWRLRSCVLACGFALAASCAHAQPAVGDGSALPPLGDDLPASTGPGDAAAPVGKSPLDRPVGDLCGRPETRAVIDRDLPGLSRRPEYIFFKHMSLRQLQAASRGQMSDADLQRVAADIDALNTGAPTAELIRTSASLR
jgi:hypothetical protein